MQNPETDGLCGRLAGRPDHVHRGGARRRRGCPRTAVRRPRGAAPHEDDRGRHGLAALVRLHRERAEVPAPRQSEPGAGRDRLVPRLSREADRPREARGARRARQVRRAVSPRNRGRHHAFARKVGKLPRNSGDAHVSPLVSPQAAGPEERGVGGSSRRARETWNRTSGSKGESDVSVRLRHVLFVLAGAAAIAATALLLTKRAVRPARAAPPVADARGLAASGRTKAERLAIEEALAAFRKEGLLLRTAEDGDAAESDEHRDLEDRSEEHTSELQSLRHLV